MFWFMCKTHNDPRRSHVMIWGLGPFVHIRGGVGREL